MLFVENVKNTKTDYYNYSDKNNIMTLLRREAKKEESHVDDLNYYLSCSKSIAKCVKYIN